MENSKKDNTIEVPVWFTDGGVMLRRDCLSIDHPEHTYNYMKNQMGLVPEYYGVFHPVNEKYESYTREELLSKIGQLERMIRQSEQYF